MSDLSALAGLGGDPQAAMARMMTELTQSNPQLAMLAQLMQTRNAAPVEEDDDEPDARDAEIAELTERLAQTQERLDAARQQGSRLLKAHREATERLADLAAALGACGRCWGEDSTCRYCRGRGLPGMVRPDPELRARLFPPPARRCTEEPAPGARQVAARN